MPVPVSVAVETVVHEGEYALHHKTEQDHDSDFDCRRNFEVHERDEAPPRYHLRRKHKEILPVVAAFSVGRKRKVYRLVCHFE